MMTPLDRVRWIISPPAPVEVLVHSADIRKLIALADAVIGTSEVEFKFLPGESCDQWKQRTKAVWQRQRDALAKLTKEDA